MKLIFPYPDMRLLPNRKAHWATLMRATKEAREQAFIIAESWIRHHEETWHMPALSSVWLTITWYPKTKRVADYDSLLRATKPIIDGGLVDSDLLADDSPLVIREVVLRVGSPDKANPRTEIEIEEVSNG